MIEPTRSQYFETLLGGEASLRWGDGHRFVELLRDHLEFHVTRQGWVYGEVQYSADGLPLFNGYCLVSDEMASELILVPSGDDLVVLVGAEQQETVHSDREVWRFGIRRALDKVREPDPEHDWWCAIGTTRGSVSRLIYLSSGLRLDENLSFEPASQLHRETVEAVSVPSLGGVTLNESYPVVVTGTSRALDWLSVIPVATERANLLCALFSIAFDHHWRIREQVQPDVGGSHLLSSHRLGSDLEGLGSSVGLREELMPPSWMTQAWRRLNDDPILQRAALAHHHALSLEESSPSYSLVGYVGAIEGLGEKVEPVEVCDCCADCKIVVGAVRRFRRAVRQVLSASETRRFEKLYKSRSATAHEGALFGGEQLAGGLTISMDSFNARPPQDTFRFESLWEVRRVSRDLLVKFLSGTEVGTS